MILTVIISYLITFLFGTLIGNFTTTIFHRLPRNIMISGFDKKLTQPPFCSNCGHILRFYEYLPILSWFSTFGKCNYCHIAITKSYIALEILIGLIAIILYYLFGQNLEYFFIYFCFATLVILNIFIYLKHNFVPINITLGIIALGIIYRTLTDQEILLWVTSLSLAAIISLWIIRNSLVDIRNSEDKNTISTATVLVHLILPASLWCQNYGILIFTAIIIFLHLFPSDIMKKLNYPIGIITILFIGLYH